MRRRRLARRRLLCLTLDRGLCVVCGSGKKTYGLDMMKGGITDMTSIGIRESFKSKLQVHRRLDQLLKTRTHIVRNHTHGGAEQGGDLKPSTRLVLTLSIQCPSGPSLL